VREGAGTTTEVKKTMEQRISRRQFGRFAAAGTALTVLGGLRGNTFAQEIESTRLGEVPTTGGLRPGPIGINPPPPLIAEGALPVSIQIPKAQVDAQVETIEIVDGVMQNPTGPWVVSWYKETARLGELGNAVMAGHLDYWDVGPAVFYNITQLVKDDTIDVIGEDGEVYTYAVEWIRNYDTANAPIQEIVGPTDAENLTLITCGGPFDYANGVYLQRTVVRAARQA
jgi:sortase (surface protein transpeptidase)